MKHVWDLYPNLTALVRKDHEGKDCGHHPFEHALMVAQYCLIIAPDVETARLSAAAALLHNTDRLYPKMQDADIEAHVREALSGMTFAGPEKSVIVDAVLNHHKKNDPSDSPVLICLKDADRLANISPFDVIARAARAYPNLPLVNPRFVTIVDPDSSYKNPKTVFRDGVQSCLEWEEWLRLPKAKELAKPYFDGLRLVKELTARQLFETGFLV